MYLTSTTQIFRRYHLPLIPIHHMRAHAIISRFVDPSINYPFLCLLISGGHCIIALVKSADEFHLYAESAGKSPGECLDKIGRAMDFGLTTHYAVAVEENAKRSSEEGYLKYHQLFKANGADSDFNGILGYYLNVIGKMGSVEEEIPDLCASAQVKNGFLTLKQ